MSNPPTEGIECAELNAHEYDKHGDTNLITYPLSYSQLEKERLFLQHGIIKRASNGRIIFPPIGFDKSLFVLDVGTGPGAWLMDIAKLLSTGSILHGIDVTTQLFPKERPANTSCSICSVIEISKHWNETFHFVHQRFLVSVLTYSNWPIAISNLYQALRPGGWIQLCEYSYWPTSRDFTPGNASKRFEKLLFEFMDSKGMVKHVGLNLSSFLNDAGFIHVKSEEFTIPLGKLYGSIGTDASMNFRNSFKDMKDHFVGTGKGMLSMGEFEKLIDDALEEWDETKGYTIGFTVAYGQRPVP